jgi:hypothetical protein
MTDVTDESGTEEQIPEPDALELEITAGRRSIATENYPMSIGEFTNLYRDGEVDVHPEFQRFFRWDDEQKSRLIESLLLGIPLPSIFVAQTKTGSWDLVDGLQRISTLLELQGLLLDKDRNPVPQLTLQGTKYLPGLEGRTWDESATTKGLTRAQQIDIKRARLDVQIIKRESSEQAKYDLFQRLNSYGSQLTQQELRSCVLVAINRDFYAFVEELTTRESFAATVPLSERLVEQQYDLELVLRFLVLHNLAEPSQRVLKNFNEFLTSRSVELAEGFPANREELEKVFDGTFDLLAAAGGDVFRKWDATSGSFVGSFLNTSFEVFAFGLGYWLSKGEPHRLDLLGAVREFWSRGDMKNFATGKSTEARLSKYMPQGREILAGPEGISA